jgi:chitodextrinase
MKELRARQRALTRLVLACVTAGALVLALQGAIATAASSVPLRINAGGSAYTDPSGNVWAADKAYSAGSWGYDTSYGTTSTTHAIAGTTTPTLYQSSNTFNGGSGYKIDIANGTYSVTLKFLEDWANAAGQRKFDVTIEGTKVLTAFDIFAACGAYTACDRTFTTTVSDGQLDIQFAMNGGANYGTVSAIQVTGSGGGSDTTPPSAPTGLSSPSHTASSVSLSWTASTDNVGVTGYRVYRNGSQVGTPTGTTYTDSGLTASTAYTYTVKAVDAAGNLSAASNSLSVTTSAASGDTTPPSAPASLTSPSHTSSSVSLSWSASTDNVGVTGYRVYRNGSQVGTPTGTSYTDSGLTASTAYSYTVKAIDAAGNLSAASNTLSVTTSATTGGGINYGAAPYLMPLDNNPPSVTTVMNATGIKTFTLAFILANGNSSCSPSWDATDPVSSDTQVQAVINTIRANGGDVVPSVGGYGGTKLGQVCGDGPSTYNAYNQVVTKYALKAVDFDIEEPEIENETAVKNELYAAQQLQAHGIHVTVTLPTLQSGLNWFGNLTVKDAIAMGFTPSSWSVMPFDFGGSTSGMGTTIVNTAEALHAQLKGLYPSLTDAQVYAITGLSLMNGRSDTGEITTQADFNQVKSYEASHHMPRFTYWSLNRDRQCSPPDNNGTTSGTCSSVAQADWDFTKIVAGYTG